MIFCDKRVKIFFIFALCGLAVRSYLLNSRILAELQEELEILRRENFELKLKFQQLLNNQSHVNFEPSLIYEKKRRRIRKTILYLWMTVKNQIARMEKKIPSEELSGILNSIYEHKISLLSDLKQMSEQDGYENWRQSEFRHLSQVVQDRIYELQHPRDCENAKKLICQSDGTLCGWGCQLEKYAQCLVFALGTGRVLHFVKDPEAYYERDEFVRYYQPTTSCHSLPNLWNPDVPMWTGSNEPKIVRAAFLRGIQPRIKFLFVAIPESLAPRLEKLVDNPSTWWMAEIENYLLKMKPEVKKVIDETAEKIGFKHPIVGLHVRRTDKPMVFRALEDYMEHVKEFYDTLELTQRIDQRRVFLCTDEPKIVHEAQQKYPDYEFLVNIGNADEANNLKVRYKSAINVMKDEFLLARCDFLVGTLSSNVLRRAYELKHWSDVYAQEKTVSLDFRHIAVAENPQKFRVLIAHQSNNQSFIDADVQDVLEAVDSFDNDGTLHVKSMNSSKVGLIPTFKVEKLVETVNFESFEREAFA